MAPQRQIPRRWQPTIGIVPGYGTVPEVMVPLAAGTCCFVTSHRAAVAETRVPMGNDIAESSRSIIVQLQVHVCPGYPRDYRGRITGIP